MTATESKRPARGKAPTPAPAPREALEGLEDVLGSMYPKAIKFDAPGDVHTLIIEGLGAEQDRDYDTGDPLFWDDGRPKKVLAIYGALEGDEEGTWWVRGRRAERALREAMRLAKVRELSKGDRLTIVRGEDELVEPKGKQSKPTYANTYEVTLDLAGTWR